MQAQLASNITFHQARVKKQTWRPARGEQGSNCSLSHHRNSVYRRIGKDNGIHPAESNFTEYSTGHEESAKARTKAHKVHTLGFSYLALSFHYILRKVKAFCGGFLGGVANESMVGNEAPMLDPYFSIPVLPHP